MLKKGTEVEGREKAAVISPSKHPRYRGNTFQEPHLCKGGAIYLDWGGGLPLAPGGEDNLPHPTGERRAQVTSASESNREKGPKGNRTRTSYELGTTNSFDGKPTNRRKGSFH